MFDLKKRERRIIALCFTFLFIFKFLMCVQKLQHLKQDKKHRYPHPHHISHAPHPTFFSPSWEILLQSIGMVLMYTKILPLSNSNPYRMVLRHSDTSNNQIEATITLPPSIEIDTAMLFASLLCLKRRLLMSTLRPTRWTFIMHALGI